MSCGSHLSRNFGVRGIAEALYPYSVVVPYRPYGTTTELAFLDSCQALSRFSRFPRSEDPDQNYWNFLQTGMLMQQTAPIPQGESTEYILRLRASVAGTCYMTILLRSG